MAEPATKLPIKSEEKGVERRAESWLPFESLRSEIDRLFDDFAPSLWHRPLASALMRRVPRLSELDVAPAVDLAETEKTYEITCELPGMEEKDIEVAISNGTLTIRGEKQEEKKQRIRKNMSSLSVATARSSGRSGCQMGSIQKRSLQNSRRAFCR